MLLIWTLPSIICRHLFFKNGGCNFWKMFRDNYALISLVYPMTEIFFRIDGVIWSCIFYWLFIFWDLLEGRRSCFTFLENLHRVSFYISSSLIISTNFIVLIDFACIEQQWFYSRTTSFNFASLSCLANYITPTLSFMLLSFISLSCPLFPIALFRN